jgi:serine/threonine-protein kinase
VEQVREALQPRYLVGDVIGWGASAIVLQAEDTRHRRRVAIKLLRPDVSPIVGHERFLQEIEIAARLQHPHILPLFDSGVADGILYFVMPFVAGENLRQYLVKVRQVNLPEAVRITDEIAAALMSAHRQNVIHRDVKPENILIAEGRMLVADFGIARMLQPDLSVGQTVPGLVFGTPGYMSPEQAAGGPLDASADQYALACIVYEMLAGEAPFAGASPREVMARQLADPYTPLQRLRPELPLVVDEVIGRALARIPAERFESVEAFAEALGRTVRRSAAVPRPAAAPRRRWKEASVALALGLLVLVAILLTRTPAVPVSTDRVAVFPLAAPQEIGQEEGVAAAAYLGYVLEGTDPLQWQDGRDWIAAGSSPSTATLRSLARGHGAAWFVDGVIVQPGDSVTVIVRLQDVLGDSIVARSGRTGPRGASIPLLAARAMGDLLPTLVQPGRPIDVSALRDRNPAAITHFLRADGYYRDAVFDSAQQQYLLALEADSTFALAALKGATAAEWQGDYPGARALAQLASRNAQVLTRRDAMFAEGLRFAYDGKADSALRRFDSLISLAPQRPEGWMARGEVYYHLLPSVAHLGVLDSSAGEAFRRAALLDTTFTPALYHLVELALRRGDTAAAARDLARFSKHTRDSSGVKVLRMMWRCASGGTSGDDWPRLAVESPSIALDAAKAVSAVGSMHDCAREGFARVIANEQAPPAIRFPALVALQNLLVAEGRTAEVSSLLASEAARPLRGELLFLMDAHTRQAFDSAAAAVAAGLGTSYEAMPARYLWLLGLWHARRGDVANARAILAALQRRNDSTPSDAVFRRVLTAHTAAATGDTATALAALDSLSWNQGIESLTWDPWGGFGAERLLQARLRLGRGDTVGALRSCGVLDSQQPIAFMLFKQDCTSLTRQLMSGGAPAGQDRPLNRR